MISGPEILQGYEVKSTQKAIVVKKDVVPLYNTLATKLSGMRIYVWQ